MSLNFFLFLPVQNKGIMELESAHLTWVYEDENHKLKAEQGTLQKAAVATSTYHITIVLPGEDVLFLKAEVPGKNIQRLRQAIPYVLEDSVIDDVDNLHFAITKPKDNFSNEYGISVINKAYLESLIQKLDDNGIQADVITADYLLLNDNSVLTDGVRIIFNSENVKFSSPIQSEIIVNNEDLSEIKSLKLIDCEKESNQHDQIEALIKNIVVDKISCEGCPELCLIENSSKKSSINILQGLYKKKKDWSNTGKTWFPVAVLLLIWLFIQTGFFLFDYIGLSKQNDDLNLKITHLYKKSFPDSRRIIDAKAQMQQKLVELRKRKGKSGRSFTKMLSDSASVFSEAKGLNIKSLRYYDGQISLEINIASLQALDKLKERLQNEKGYQVEIQNASSGKETVTARLQISGAKL